MGVAHRLDSKVYLDADHEYRPSSRARCESRVRHRQYNPTVPVEKAHKREKSVKPQKRPRVYEDLAFLSFLLTSVTVRPGEGRGRAVWLAGSLSSWTDGALGQMVRLSREEEGIKSYWEAGSA